MRTIKILPDSGSMVKFDAADGINVERFLALALENGLNIDLSKTKLVEKVSKASFDTGDALLPDGDITLFTVIRNPKGNEMSRKQLYAQISKFKKRDGDRAVDYFYGFTTMTNSVLEGKINLYSKKAPIAKNKAPKTTKVAASKAKSTTRKKVSREEAEVIAARTSYKSTAYNKLG